MRLSQPIRYAKISLKRRMQLVELVDKSNKSISKAAKRLAIKLSTAKMIVKRWREDGSFFQTKQKGKGSLFQQAQVEDVKQAQPKFQGIIPDPIRHNNQRSNNNEISEANLSIYGLHLYQNFPFSQYGEYYIWVPSTYIPYYYK